MKTIKTIAVLLIFFFYSGLIFAQEPLEDAKKLTMREQFDQAGDMYKKLILANPGMGDIYYFYADNELWALYSDTITRSEKETLLSCKKINEQGIEKDPSNPINLIGLARLDFIADNKQAANEKVNKVKAMIPAMDVKIKKIVDPKRYALLLTELAKVYIAQGKIDTSMAFPLLRRAAQVDPKNAQIFITIGDAYLVLREPSNAIANYNIAQSLDPNSPVAKQRIGYMYIRAKNLNAAISSLEEALKIDQNFAPAYKELGFVYSLAGKPDKSKPNYEKYLQLSGNNIPAKISYVISLFKSSNYKECITQINQIFAVDSSINSMNRVVAYSYFETKDYVKAQYYLEKFLKNIAYDPNKVITKDYIYYGRILGERGFTDRADENLRKAINLDPSLLHLYSEIADYQNKAKNYKKAIAALEDKKTAKAMKIGDYYYLGRYYYSDLDYQKSFETFDFLLKMNDPKLKSYEMLALTFQGYSALNIDSTFEQGLGKPVYEKMLEKSMTDTVKYAKNLVDVYSYFGSYYLLNKVEKDNGKSKQYFLKVLAIDPNNERAKLALTLPELQKAKLPD